MFVVAKMKIFVLLFVVTCVLSQDPADDTYHLCACIDPDYKNCYPVSYEMNVCMDFPPELRNDISSIQSQCGVFVDRENDNICTLYELLGCTGTSKFVGTRNDGTSLSIDPNDMANSFKCTFKNPSS